MRKATILISAIIVFCLINFAVYQKQQILKEGEIVLLELSPADPRSLLQGDYMALRYNIEDDMKSATLPQTFHQGFIVIRKDADSIGHFVRVFQGETLANNEKLVKFHYRPTSWRKVVIKPNTYFFQEGKAKQLSGAKYAILQYRGNKDYLLIGLADKDKKAIKTNR